MAKNAREIALSALLAFRKGGAWSDGYLKNALKDVERREASLASQLTYGVLQNSALLDFYIESYSSIKMSKIAPRILDILRLGAYQIAFLDKIPKHAAVNEAVRMARRDNPRAAGFVNAVLRRISENAANLPTPNGEEVETLAVKYSHPKWLVKKLLLVFGDDCVEILRENNKAPDICARVNTLKTNTTELVEKLSDEGVCASAHPWLENCIILSDTGDISKVKAFEEGLFHVCDPASQLAAIALGARAGMNVLDTCAAPGGKSFTIAQEMENTGCLLSCDIHEHKLKLIQKGAERLHITNINCELRDARERDEAKKDKFDAVLCDVPCSGLGVIRKKPEIRFKNEDEIARLPEIQLDIIKTASKYVASGGVLVYSTCTILPCENSEVIGAFLKENPDFMREKIQLSCPNGENEGEITLLPHKNETDGFFICKLRRAK